MAEGYRRISQYEKEILELKEQGLTKREIGEKLGFSKEQIKNFFKNKRRKNSSRNTNWKERKTTKKSDNKRGRQDCRIKIYTCPKRNKNKSIGNGK